MSYFRKFMLRRGWIQLEPYGLEVTGSGRVKSAPGAEHLLDEEQCNCTVHAFDLAPTKEHTSFRVTETIFDFARTTEHAIFRQAAPISDVPRETSSSCEDEHHWQEAIARAKEEKSIFGLADTAMDLKPTIRSEVAATVVEAPLFSAQRPTPANDDKPRSFTRACLATEAERRLRAMREARRLETRDAYSASGLTPVVPAHPRPSTESRELTQLKLLRTT